MRQRPRRGRRGETLTEVLAAILVVGISIAILSTMVSTSMSINAKARERDTGADGFYDALTDVETHVFTTADQPMAVKVTGGPVTVTLSSVYAYTAGGQTPLTVYGKGG